MMPTSQISYTAYTLIPIPVDTREDAALYFCAYGGCLQRFQTPCDLQKHRLESECGAISNIFAASMEVGDVSRHTTDSSFDASTRCLQCCTYIASCSYRLLVEHVRIYHCGIGPHSSASSRPWLDTPTLASGTGVLSRPEPHNQNPRGKPPQLSCVPSPIHPVHNAGSCPGPSEAITTLNLNSPAGQSPSAGAPTIIQNLDWEKHKHILHWLYVEQDNNLEQVMEYMMKHYDFNAKKRTFKEKLKLWGFEKNIPAKDMQLIVAIVDERKRKQGKDTRVYFKGRLVDAKKMDRFKKRKLHYEAEEEASLDSITRYVRCETPLIEPIKLQKSPGELSQTNRDLDTLPQYIDLHTLGDVILAEYEGKTKDPLLLSPQLRCRSACSVEVGNLFDKAFTYEDQGDLENSENVYLELLGKSQTELDMGAIFDALRGILRVRAIGCEYAPALPELERLVAGCLCLYGPDHTTYRVLGIELAISYYKLERFEEGNTLVKRLLSIYKDYSGFLNELSCERLLYWTSFRLKGISQVPSFKELCARLLKQYQEGGKLNSALTLAMDITDGLQFSDNFEEAEVYLQWAVSIYEKPGNFDLTHIEMDLAHVETLTCILLNQVTHYTQTTSVEELLLDTLQRDILHHFAPSKPGALPVIPLTRLALCYSVLGLHSKAHALYQILDLEDKALRANCSRENWKLFIQGLGDQACNLASLGELEVADRLFILAEEIAQRELGATHWRTKRAVADLNAFHHRDPDLWAGRFIVRLRSVDELRDALASPIGGGVLM